ncbi:Transposase [compost metagenome]
MASFQKYKTKNKGELWLFKLDVGKDPQSGDRKTTTRRGFKTKKEAQMAASKLEQEVFNGEYIPDTGITFSEYVPIWMKHYKSVVKISTFDLRVRMTEILKKYFSALKMNDITKKHYQSMLDDLTEKYAHNSLSIIHSTGNLIFKKALEDGIIKKDPTEFTHIKKKNKTLDDLDDIELPKFLEKSELIEFLNIAKKRCDHEVYSIFLLLAYSGLRIGELLALKWSDIDLVKKTISITKTCYFPKNKITDYVLLPPKTKASKRIVIVDDEIINNLKKHIDNQNTIISAAGEHIYKNNGFVFTSKKYPGYPFGKVTVEYFMKQILLNSKIDKNISPHSLRHTHVTLMAEADISLFEIMDRLGHDDDEVTKRIYLHVTKTKRESASRKFFEFMKE